MTAIAERPGPETAAARTSKGVFAPIDDGDRRRVSRSSASCPPTSPACSCATARTRSSRRRVGTTGSTATGCCTRCTSRTGTRPTATAGSAPQALEAETAAGEAIWTGINERPDFSHPGGPFKDTANTDLVFHAGPAARAVVARRSLLPGRAAVARDRRRATTSAARCPKGLTAHPKLDPATGELMVFDYDVLPPYLTYSVMSADGQMVHHTDLDLPGPRLLHDLAITEHHTIFLDFPLMWDPELLAKGKTQVTFRDDMPARFGVLGRHADGDTVRWFEAESCYMYHTINAWESGDEIVLVGCRIENPLARSRRLRHRPAHRRAAARAVPARVAVQPRDRRGARARARRRDDRVPAHEQPAPRPADALLVQPAPRRGARRCCSTAS